MKQNDSKNVHKQWKDKVFKVSYKPQTVYFVRYGTYRRALDFTIFDRMDSFRLITIIYMMLFNIKETLKIMTN